MITMSAVGLGVGHFRQADPARRARLVQHHDGLRQMGARGVAHGPRHGVRAASRGKRHHDLDGPVGEILRQRHWPRGQRGAAQQRGKNAAIERTTFHGVSPDYVYVLRVGMRNFSV
jgi:hypothetical protein